MTLLAQAVYSLLNYINVNDEELPTLWIILIFSQCLFLGGFESLILCNQPEEIAKIRPGIERKLTGSLIRVHIGFEDTDELIADLQAGFDRIK